MARRRPPAPKERPISLATAAVRPVLPPATPVTGPSGAQRYDYLLMYAFLGLIVLGMIVAIRAVMVA